MWDSMGQFQQNLQTENQGLKAENERLQGLIRELSCQIDLTAAGEAQRIRALVVGLAEKHAAAGLVGYPYDISPLTPSTT